MLYIIIGVSIVILAVFLHVFLFIFTHGSSPGKDKAQNNFIDATCAPSGLLKTVLTFGYAKASYRRCYNYYRLMFKQKAKLGQAAPDCKVVDLNGNNQLLSKYINAVPKGMPLIINSGSYT